MSDHIDPPDISDYLARLTEAEREVIKLFGSDAPKVIFDIGACEGEDSIRFARRFPKARIFAFEPLPSNQRLVRVNIARHHVNNVELVPTSLSDREGHAVFHVSSGNPPELYAGPACNYGNKSSSLLPPVRRAPMHGWIEFNEEISVPTVTLDSFCARQKLSKIDFIHMDVQGAEKLVLNGASSMLRQITAIWLEVASHPLYRGQALAPEILRHMRSRGFYLAHATYLADASGEGDHFYVNLRHARAWPYLISKFAHSGCSRARLVLGRVRRALTGPPPSTV